MIRPAVLAGLSVLLAAWSAEGATVYHRAAARPSGATAALGGPAAKPAAVIGGPVEPKGGLPGARASRTPGPSLLAHKSRPGGSAPASAGQGAPPAAAAHGPSQPHAARAERSEPKDKPDGRAARR